MASGGNIHSGLERVYYAAFVEYRGDLSQVGVRKQCDCGVGAGCVRVWVLDEDSVCWRYCGKRGA